MSPLVVASLLVLLVASCSKPTTFGAASREVSRTEIHSASLPPVDAGVPGEANGYLAAVRREQAQLREKLLDAITSLDRRGEAAGGGRQQLRDDLVAIDRSDERGWDELKAEVERDLAAVGNH